MGGDRVYPAALPVLLWVNVMGRAGVPHTLSTGDPTHH